MPSSAAPLEIPDSSNKEISTSAVSSMERTMIYRLIHRPNRVVVLADRERCLEPDTADWHFVFLGEIYPETASIGVGVRVI